MTVESVQSHGFLGSLIMNLLANLQTLINPRVFRIAVYEFIVRCTQFNLADPRWRMKFSKMIKSVQNFHLRVFEVTDYEFIVIFTKFNMADSRR